MTVRPFHPEAYLLLAEVAQKEGNVGVARVCAERARRMAPGLKRAKKLLRNLPKKGGQDVPEWMVIPGEKTEGSKTENGRTVGEGRKAVCPQQLGKRRRKVGGAEERLTVCLIAKNEERCLGRCLASVEPIAWQVVVVDTGSTDRIDTHWSPC